MRRTAIFILLLITACNYDTGECFLRGEGVQGAGGIIILPPGTGGFGDVPPEPDDTSEPPECAAADEVPASAQVRCLVPASETCVEQCYAIKAYCIHRAAHPYSLSSGIGDLYWCKGGWPSYTCSYQYSNGDNCTLIYPIGKWYCRYEGGKQ